MKKQKIKMTVCPMAFTATVYGILTNSGGKNPLEGIVENQYICSFVFMRMTAPTTPPPTLFDTLKNNAGFSDQECEKLDGFFHTRILKKKEHFLRTGEVAHSTAYVVRGCTRRYIVNEHGKEIILGFAIEGWWTGDLESFFQQKPTEFFVQALEETELKLLSYENFQQACLSIPKYKAFHEAKVQRNHFATLKRLVVSKSGTAREKYLLLMEEQPQLFQRIPLHYIAAYLGIEPESLSRLRKQLSKSPEKTNKRQ